MHIIDRVEAAISSKQEFGSRGAEEQKAIFERQLLGILMQIFYPEAGKGSGTDGPLFSLILDFVINGFLANNRTFDSDLS